MTCPNNLVIIFQIIILGSVISGCNSHDYELTEENVEYDQKYTYNNKVDVLLVVDNSTSMNTYQDRLASEAPALIGTLDSLGLDYRIAAVSTDVRKEGGGSGNQFLGTPAILSKSTPDLQNLLAKKIQIGQNGATKEQGITSLKTAFGSNGSSAQKSGFLRSEALLAIIVLSDEDDFSPDSVASDISYFNQLKPLLPSGHRNWVLNYIGIPGLHSSCKPLLGGTLKPGWRWITLAQESGGIIEEICRTSLNDVVNNIKKRIISYLTAFYLNRKPVVESIKVSIDGRSIAQDNVNGWEYIEDGYFLRFHGDAIPAADAKLSIEFTPAEAK